LKSPQPESRRRQEHSIARLLGRHLDAAQSPTLSHEIDPAQGVALTGCKNFHNAARATVQRQEGGPNMKSLAASNHAHSHVPYGRT